jgi:hypothetical protein
MRSLNLNFPRYSVVVAASMCCLTSIQSASATSLRFFGTGANNIDRVRVLIDQDGPAGGPPADVGATDFTVEFWMKGAAGNTATGAADGDNFSWIFGNIIIDRASVSQGTSWGMAVSSGRMCFGVANVSNAQYTACGSANVLDDQWHHIAVQRRRSDGQMWLFVDGTLDRQVNGPDGDLSYVDNQVPPNVCGPFQSEPCPQERYVVFGAEKYDFNRLQYPSYFGWMDEIRFSSSLRYPTNGGGFTRPSAAFAPDAQTAALYHFDEGSGNTINDSAPGGASPGERLAGGSPQVPQWSTDTPFGASAGSVQFQSANPGVAENVGGGTATITVTRTGGSSGAASVNYQTSGGGTASAGVDYLSAAGTLNWGTGDAAPKPFTVTILDDAAVEGGETVGLTLSSASGAALGSPQNATLTINDNDTAPVPGTLQLSAASFTTNEGSGTVTLNVTRSGGSSGTVSINYSTSDGTAVVGNDYANATGTLMWQGGDAAAKPISVSIVNDTQAESAESFSVTLSSPSGGATLGAPASATVTINDDDSTSPPPPPPGNDSNGGGGGGSTGALLLSLLALSLGVRSRRQAAAPR